MPPESTRVVRADLGAANVGNRNPGSSIRDAPFGYQISYRSTSSSSPESFGPQEHIHRVNKQLRHRMKEVPNLENVEAFFSDFSEPEDNPYHNVSMGESARAVGSDKNENVYKANPHCAMQHHSVALRQVDRVLSSAWKFNPLYGATAASLEDPPSDTELSAEELKLLESIKEKQVAARATRLQRMYAQGLLDLQKTKSRNEKRLNIQTWAEDISDLDDAVFVEEVRNNSFCSRRLSSDNIGSDTQDVDHCENHGTVLKDSGTYKEDELLKEAFKPLPASNMVADPLLREEAITDSSAGNSANRIIVGLDGPGESYQKNGFDVPNTSGLGVASSVNEKSMYMLHPDLEGESVHTSSILFDDANAPLDGSSRVHPYDLYDMTMGSVVDRAKKDTLFLDDLGLGLWSDRGHHKRVVETSPSPRPPHALQMATEAHLEARSRTAPDRMNQLNANDRNAHAVAIPNASYLLSAAPGHSSRSTDDDGPYRVPTPICPVASSPRASPAASNVAIFNGPGERFRATHASNPTHPQQSSAHAPGTASSVGMVFLDDNRPLSAPTPMHPRPSPRRNASKTSHADNSHASESDGAIFRAPTPVFPGLYMYEGSAEASDAILRSSPDDGGLRAATLTNPMLLSWEFTERTKASSVRDIEEISPEPSMNDDPEPPSSASRQLIKDLHSAANKGMAASPARGQSYKVRPYAPTSLVLEESEREENSYHRMFRPTTARSVSPYRSPYPSLPVVDNGNRQQISAPGLSSFRNSLEHRNLGTLSLPRLPAFASSYDDGSMQRDWSIPGNEPRLEHQDSNVSMEVHADSSSGSVAPDSPKPELGPNAQFAAGVSSSLTWASTIGRFRAKTTKARELATSVTRPPTPTCSVDLPHSLSPAKSALDLTLPPDRPYAATVGVTSNPRLGKTSKTDRIPAATTNQKEPQHTSTSVARDLVPGAATGSNLYTVHPYTASLPPQYPSPMLKTPIKFAPLRGPYYPSADTAKKTEANAAIESLPYDTPASNTGANLSRPSTAGIQGSGQTRASGYGFFANTPAFDSAGNSVPYNPYSTEPAYNAEGFAISPPHCPDDPGPVLFEDGTTGYLPGKNPAEKKARRRNPAAAKPSTSAAAAMPTKTVVGGQTLAEVKAREPSVAARRRSYIAALPPRTPKSKTQPARQRNPAPRKRAPASSAIGSSSNGPTPNSDTQTARPSTPAPRKRRRASSAVSSGSNGEGLRRTSRPRSLTPRAREAAETAEEYRRTTSQRRRSVGKGDQPAKKRGRPRKSNNDNDNDDAEAGAGATAA